ncbi:MAG: ATP-binding protein [Chitinophagaceae bacterium]
MKTAMEHVGNSLSDLLIDSSIDGFISFNLNWEVTAWNKTTENITGLMKTAALGNNLRTVYPEMLADKETHYAITRCFEGFKTFLPPSAAFRHRFHLENNYIPLLNDNGTVYGVLNIIHDVSHRIKTELQLKALNDELDKRYTQLLSTSSELANFTYTGTSSVKEPMRYIYTAVEHLVKTESAQLSNPARAAFRRIQSSLTKMNLVLDDMLKLAQINIIDKPGELVDLTEIVTILLTSMESVIKEKQAIVTVGTLGTIRGHRKQLEMLFHQLLDNALKFNHSVTPAIDISSSAIASDTIAGKSSPDVKYLCVVVKDNGIGVQPGDADRIFNIFEKGGTTQRYKGAGIGLAIAKKIMYAHNGFIRAVSNAENGTAFECFFPEDDSTIIF